VRTKNFFVSILSRTQRRDRQTAKELENAKSQNRDLEFLKIRDRRKTKLPQANLQPNKLQQAAVLIITTAPTKLQGSCFTFRRFPMHRHSDAQLGLLNSAPMKQQHPSG
jgi:hypothetical protein